MGGKDRTKVLKTTLMTTPRYAGSLLFAASRRINVLVAQRAKPYFTAVQSLARCQVRGYQTHNEELEWRTADR